MNKRIQDILSLAQAGQIQKAITKCDQALKKKTRDIDLLLLLASLHAQSNNFLLVAEYCKRASMVSPKNLSALYNLSVAYMNLQDYENAERVCKKVLAIDKKNANTLSNLGLAQWHLRELENAAASCEQALKLEPKLATAHNNLGLIYKSMGKKESAIQCFKQAINHDPRLAEAYYNCGIILLEDNDESGNDYLDKSLLINDRYPEANNYKGLQLLEKGQSSIAIDYFQKAIQNKQDYSEAYCNLGNALMMKKDFITADAMYRKAIEYNPEYASAYNNLGNALLDQDNYRENYAEAEECYLKAIKLAPELNDTYKNLAVCYQGQGIHDKALHYFKQYNERVPNDEAVIAGMASVHERRGDFDEGMALIEPFINNANVSAEIILSYAKLSKQFKQIDQAINALLSIEDEHIENKLRIEKYYALGKLSESGEDSDATFNYYKQANDLEDEKFDVNLERDKFNAIKSYFAKDKVQSLQRSKNNSKLPIFIVGMPRSGTSLAEQILASHPDVYGAGELENIHYLVQRIGKELEPRNNYPSCMDSITIDYATKLSNEYLNALQEMAPEAKYIVDKMPHNFMGLGVINILFPNATVIHCKRSSIDTCLSIYFQHFNKHHSYSNSLSKLGEYYNLYADMMDHWKSVLDINFVELQYENVITNPEYEMRNLLENCGIEWDPACLSFHENKRTVMTPSYDQVRKPIYNSSVAKWKKYQHHLQNLIEALGDRAY